jgi:hypothetical protein
MSYAMIALVTDYDCWRRPPTPETSAPGATDPDILLKEIIANLRSASDNGIRLIRQAVQRIAERRDELLASPARDALRMAIWSDKSRIPRDEVERLGAIWGRYF